MPYKSKEDKKAYLRRYYQANRERLNERSKEYSKKKRQEIKEMREVMKKLLNIL